MILLRLAYVIVTCRISLSHVSFKTSIRVYLVSRFSCVLLRQFIVCDGWLRMIAYVFLIVFAVAFVRILLVALAVYAVRITKIGGIAASFSRIRVFTARYTSKTVRRLLF